MNKGIYIRFKASLLLIIFMSNIICWGCPMGFCMCDNLTETSELKSPGSTANNNIEKKCCCKKKELADKQAAGNNRKTDHCNNNSLDFSKVDKCCPENIVHQMAPCRVAISSPFHHASFVPETRASANTKYQVCGLHPPARDIRIAIQSFQI
jgi:hypothetical protein